MKKRKKEGVKKKTANGSANCHYVGFSKKSLEHFKRIHTRGDVAIKSNSTSDQGYNDGDDDKKQEEVSDKEKSATESKVYVGFTKKELEHIRRTETKGKTVKKSK